LILQIRCLTRVSTLVVILFLFIGCAGKSRAWNFDDIYSLDVRILDTKDWLSKTKRELKDLNKIVKPKLKYYLKKDFEVYSKLEPHYEAIQLNVLNVDSLTIDIDNMVSTMKANSSYSLDTVPYDTTKSYRTMIEYNREKIKKNQNDYYNNIEKLKKGFKFDKKLLVFINEESLELKKQLYEIKYKRETIAPYIIQFNKKLSKALFDNPNSSYSKRIIKISKNFESYRIKLDKYEKFLSNIENIAKKEAGGYVILRPKNAEPMKYLKYYEEGMEEYLDILIKIRKISESI